MLLSPWSRARSRSPAGASTAPGPISPSASWSSERATASTSSRSPTARYTEGSAGRPRLARRRRPDGVRRLRPRRSAGRRRAAPGLAAARAAGALRSRRALRARLRPLRPRDAARARAREPLRPGGDRPHGADLRREPRNPADADGRGGDRSADRARQPPSARARRRGTRGRRPRDRSRARALRPERLQALQRHASGIPRATRCSRGSVGACSRSRPRAAPSTGWAATSSARCSTAAASPSTCSSAPPPTALAADGDGFSITASYGCVELPEEATDAAEAMRLADQRMYANKNSHRASAEQQSVGRPADGARRAEPGPRRPRQRRRRARRGRGAVARPDGDRGRAGADRRRPPRRRQDGDPGRDPVQAGRARRRGVGVRAAPHADRRDDHARGAGTARPRRGSSAPATSASTARGYPDGLAGEEIPLGSRIIFVCDAFDAMLSARPYSPPLPVEHALARAAAATRVRSSTRSSSVRSRSLSTNVAPVRPPPGRQASSARRPIRASCGVTASSRGSSSVGGVRRPLPPAIVHAEGGDDVTYPACFHFWVVGSGALVATVAGRRPQPRRAAPPRRAARADRHRVLRHGRAARRPRPRHPGRARRHERRRRAHRRRQRSRSAARSSSSRRSPASRRRDESTGCSCSRAS